MKYFLHFRRKTARKIRQTVPQGGWVLEQAHRGSGHGTEVLEFKSLDNTLIYMF